MSDIFRPLSPFGFTRQEREALAKARLLTPEQLWEKAAEKPATPLAELSTATNLTPARLAATLAKGGKAEAKAARGTLIARHWLDIAVLAGIVLVVALARQEAPKRETPHARLVAPVAAFQVLAAADVTDTTALTLKGSTTRGGLPGRLTLRSMKAGEAVTAADLGPRIPPEALAGRAVVSFSTHPVRAAAVPQPGTRMGLVLSPRAPGGGTGALLQDVLVLSVARTDSMLRIVAAVPQADLSAVALLVGSSDVHLIAAPVTP